MRRARRSTRLPSLLALALIGAFVCNAIDTEATNAHNAHNPHRQPQPHPLESVSDAPAILQSTAIRMEGRTMTEGKHAPDTEDLNCGVVACAEPSFAPDMSAATRSDPISAGFISTRALAAPLELRPRTLATLPNELESSSTGADALEDQSASSSAGDQAVTLDSATAADTNSTAAVTDGVTGTVVPGGAEGGAPSSGRRGHSLVEWVVIPCALVALTALLIMIVATSRHCREKRRLQQEKDDAVAAGVGMVVAAHGKFPYVNPLSPPTIIVETCPLPPIQVLPRVSVYGRRSVAGVNDTSDGFGDVRTRVPNNTICAAADALSWEELRTTMSGHWATRHSVHGDGRTASVADSIDVNFADQMII